MKNKRYPAIFLMMALIAALISSCTDKPVSERLETTTQVQTEAQTEMEEKLLPALPEKDFEGYEFTFLSRVIDNPDWTDWVPRDIFAEKETGSVINDAVYRRNRYVEDKYNIKVKEIQSISFESDMKKIIKAGDPLYDVVCPGLADAAKWAQEGLFVDLNTVDYINLDQPWWNQNAKNELSIDNRLYFMQGDLTILDNDATEAMIFNKKLIADFGLESPYDLVKNGKWTMDKVIEYTKAGMKDVNADGVMDKEDNFGLVTQLDAMTSFVHGAGEVFGYKDKNDLPIDNFPHDRMYNVIDKVLEMMYQEGAINLHHYENIFPIYAYQTDMFSANKGLISWVRMRVVETLRGMEADFGIIPMPKYDEAQQDYYSSVNIYTSCAIVIPKSCSDIDRAGFVLEALSAESRYTLQPAYYDVALMGKFARDEESREMLDIIFGNAIYDVMDIYIFGNFTRQYTDLARKNKTEYASLYDKMKAKIDSDIAKCIANYEKYN